MVQTPFTDNDLSILVRVFSKRRECKALLVFLRNQYGLTKTTVHRRAYRSGKGRITKRRQ